MIFAFGDCEVDVDCRELRRAGKATHVEPQVFDLLVHLVEHRDRVVGKDELFHVVWNDRSVSEATLTSRISAARRAIGDDGQAQIYLRTVPRRGFRFVGTVQELGLIEMRGAASPDRASQPLGAMVGAHAEAEKPSIAVLPFTNLSGDVTQEYFADGIAADLIAGLSRVRWLRVIARSSSFSYKGKPTDPRQVGHDLGVRYIVDGSVRRASDRVRISIELVDALSATQLWSVHYDRTIADIFAVQDDIARAILGAIEPELASAEWERARRKPADNLTAWEHYRRGTWHLYRFAAEEIDLAKQHCRLAIAADSEFAQAYVALAYACHLSLIFDYVADRAATLSEGLHVAQCAVQLDDRDSFAHAILGRLHMMARDFDRAIAETRTAIELNPYGAQAYFGLGFALVVAGHPEQALEPLRKAIELSPRDPNLSSFATVLATAYVLLDRSADAVEWARFATRQPLSHVNAYMLLTIALVETGDAEGTRMASERVLQLKPDFRCDFVARCWPFKNRRDEARLVQALAKAGF
jgi:TolB-like protein/Tfp pilus assembly protein PilF